MFYSFVTIFLSIILTWKYSVSSVYRLAHINTEFSPPVPFEINNETQYISILGGETATVKFSATGNTPDSLLIEFKPIAFQKDKDSVLIRAAYNENGFYETKLLDVFQNYRYRAYLTSTKFWEPWNEISSKDYSISHYRQAINKRFIYPNKLSKLHEGCPKNSKSQSIRDPCSSGLHD